MHGVGYREQVRAAGALLATLLVAALLSITSSAEASPNVALDDTRYEELARRYVLGELPAYSGGLRPLSEQRIESLLGRASPVSRWWIAPLSRLRLTATLFDESRRDYSTSAHPRDVVGGISIACEHQEGRPCGDGAGMFAELDSSAGYGSSLSGTVRLRAQAGQRYADNFTNTFELDRAYVNGELGPIAAQLGRDIVVFGPSSRTQPGWGTNAPPITHVRLSTAKPFALSESVRVNVDYVLGLLRAPQRFPHALMSIGRVQFDLGDDLEIGTMQLLQLGGQGAHPLGLWSFISEHVRRADPSAGPTDSSNRRFGGDIALRITALRARLYYSLMFEDVRAKRFIDAVRYDADHVFGIDLPALGSRGQHAALIEWQQTGFRSQEHRPRDTGFTHKGRVVGSPLGPDATAFYVGGRVGLGWGDIYPWFELARLSSDTYQQVTYGPIEHLTRGPAETRYRAGLRMRVPLQQELSVEAESIVERIDGYAFVPTEARTNVGAIASLLWSPRAPVAQRSFD